MSFVVRFISTVTVPSFFVYILHRVVAFNSDNTNEHDCTAQSITLMSVLIIIYAYTYTGHVIHSEVPSRIVRWVVETDNLLKIVGSRKFKWFI